MIVCFDSKRITSRILARIPSSSMPFSIIMKRYYSLMCIPRWSLWTRWAFWSGVSLLLMDGFRVKIFCKYSFVIFEYSNIKIYVVLNLTSYSFERYHIWKRG
jgi:hypothetical protein